MRLGVVAALVLSGCVARAAPPPSPAPSSPAAPPASATAPSGPVAERAQAIKEAAGLLEKADAQRQRGNRNFAEQLFSSAELILGPEALAEIAPLFRAGAPPRVATPLKQLPKDVAPQPAAVGASEEEEPPKPAPRRGALTGALALASGPLAGRGVVTLEPANGHWKPRPPKDRVMEQRNRDFAPKLLVVRVGSTVSFPNFDSIYHNVFSRSDAKAFDLGIYKNGQSRELVFDKEGIVHVGCNLHANMAGWIVVVGAPHYAITDAHGAFAFKSLAPGKYRLKAYGERSREPTVREIVVAPGDNKVNVTLEAEGGAPNVDKFGVARGK